MLEPKLPHGIWIWKDFPMVVAFVVHVVEKLHRDTGYRLHTRY